MLRFDIIYGIITDINDIDNIINTISQHLWHY